MILDNLKSLRKKILKLIPLPEDKEVIIYNKSFSDFINKDVQELYEINLEQYNENSTKIQELKANIKSAEEFINNAAIVNKKLDEKGHIIKIKELETEYAQKYAKIKSFERKISMYSSRIQKISSEIDFHISEGKKFSKQKEEELNEKININNFKIGELETYYRYYKEYYNEYSLLSKMLNKELAAQEKILRSALDDNTICRQCRKRYYPSATSVTRNMKVIQDRLDQYNNNFTLVKQKAEEYKKQAKLLKEENKSMKEQIKNFKFIYSKKSDKVLNLEAVKFGLFNDIEALEEELKAEVQKKGKEYQQLKNKINTYKTSLDNLIAIKQTAKELQIYKEELQQILEKQKLYINNLDFIIKFLDIKFKLYTKNLKTFFDERVKIDLFEIQEYNINEICNIEFDNIKMEFLNAEGYKELNDFLVTKLKNIGG